MPRSKAATRSAPYVLSVRLSDTHHRGALFLAHQRGHAVGRVLRDALERELRRYKQDDGTSFWEALEADPSLDLASDELADLVEE